MEEKEKVQNQNESEEINKEIRYMRIRFNAARLAKRIREGQARAMREMERKGYRYTG
ncbi:MAG: hypothetical protein WC435_00095 [Candidatus Paceibacterota bacterium]